MNYYISREAAIEKAIDTIDDWDGGCNKSRAELIRDAVNSIPSADVIPGRWIRVEERLPENMQETLCHFDDGFIATATYMSRYKDWELWQNAGEVTHWMPLPEPPKKGG